MSEPGDDGGGEGDDFPGDLDGEVLERLREEGRVTVGELADAIAGRGEYEEVHERLVEDVLPDLDAEESLAFDREEGTVSTKRRRTWERIRGVAAPRTVLPVVLLVSLPAVPYVDLDPVPFVSLGVVAVAVVVAVVAVVE